MEENKSQPQKATEEISQDIQSTIKNTPSFSLRMITTDRKVIVYATALFLLVLGVYTIFALGIFSFHSSVAPLSFKNTANTNSGTSTPSVGTTSARMISSNGQEGHAYDAVYLENFDFSKLETVEAQENEYDIEILKDKEHIYYSGGFNGDDVYLLPESDSASFEIMGYDFYKDKNYVYYHSGNDYYDSIDAVPDADAATFYVVNSSFATDKNGLFVTLMTCGGDNCFVKPERIPGVDISSLVLFTYKSLLLGATTSNIEDAFLKDKNYAYFLENPSGLNTNFSIKKTKALDLPTLTEIINNNYFIILKDKNGVYTYDTIANFEPDNDGNISSNPNLTLIKEADSASFTPIQYSGKTKLASLLSLYLKDKNHVYYAYSRCDGCARVVFSVKSISNADPSTFTNLGGGFAKDKYNIWFQGKVVEGADVSTFTVDISDDSYLHKYYNAWDKNSLYDGPPTIGDVIIYKNADKDTFVSPSLRWGSSYVKDKNHVWYRGILIPNADTASFVVDYYDSGHDKNHIYQKEEQLGSK